MLKMQWSKNTVKNGENEKTRPLTELETPPKVPKTLCVYAFVHVFVALFPGHVHPHQSPSITSFFHFFCPRQGFKERVRE